jgi:hypothetical protein
MIESSKTGATAGEGVGGKVGLEVAVFRLSL